MQAWGALYEPGERGLSIGEKENKHSVCRPYPQHWRPSRETNTYERTVDDAEPAAGYARPEDAEEPEVGLLCPTGRLCWEAYEEHGLHPTQRAQQQRGRAHDGVQEAAASASSALRASSARVVVSSSPGTEFGVARAGAVASVGLGRRALARES